MKKVFKLLRENISSKPEFIFGLILSLISAGISLVIPLIIGSAANPSFMRRILKNGLLFSGVILFVLLAYVIQGISGYILGKVGAKSMRNLQVKFVNHALKLSMKEYQKLESGDMASRLTNDVSQLAELVTNTIPKMITNIVLVIGSIIILIKINGILSLVLLGMFSILFVVILPLNRKIESLYDIHQYSLGKINSFFSKRIENISVVKAFLGEEQENSRSSVLLNNLVKNTIGITKISVIYNTLLYGLIMIFLIIIVYLASMEVIAGKITISLLIAYILYVFQAISPIMELLDGISEIAEVNGALNRVNTILRIPVERLDDGDNEVRKLSGDIVFNRVSFSYQKSKSVLKNVSFKAKRGNMTAIVGPSGVGKSTIFSLILKFYNSYSGQISIGNQDLKFISARRLRNSIDSVFQNNLLFMGTILDNLKYGKNHNVSASGANKMMSIVDLELPGKVRSVITENGKNLSGGQKQKINIARGMLGDAKIILLDEATSNLDAKSEERVMDYINKIKENKTILVIAHKLNTIRKADMIYVLGKDGTISGCGTHEELMKSNKLYREYYLENDFK